MRLREKNQGVDFQYYRPLLPNEPSQFVPSKWIHGNWSTCSEKCGQGIVFLFSVFIIEFFFNYKRFRCPVLWLLSRQRVINLWNFWAKLQLHFSWRHLYLQENFWESRNFFKKQKSPFYMKFGPYWRNEKCSRVSIIRSLAPSTAPSLGQLFHKRVFFQKMNSLVLLYSTCTIAWKGELLFATWRGWLQ